MKKTNLRETIENFWENIKTIDNCYNLDLTCILINAYFKLEKNKTY